MAASIGAEVARLAVDKAEQEVAFGGGRGHAGEGGARRGLRHDRGRMRRVEGGKMEGESCWRGTNASL
jgi:hypothetical protein